MAHAHFRLRRVRLVHQMHARLCIALRIERFRNRRRVAGPVTEVRARQFHGALHIDVAHDHQRRRVGTIELGVIRFHALAGESHDARFVTTRQSREARRFLVQQARKEHIRQPARFGPQLREIGQTLAAHALQLRLRKRGMAQHFRQHGHGIVDPAGQRRDLHDRRVPVGAGVERRAQHLETRRELERVHVARPFRERPRGELRQSFVIARITRRTRLDHRQSGHHRIGRYGGHDHAQTVRQNTRHKVREPVVARRAGGRTRRRGRSLGHGSGGW